MHPFFFLLIILNKDKSNKIKWRMGKEVAAFLAFPGMVSRPYISGWDSRTGDNSFLGMDCVAVVSATLTLPKVIFSMKSRSAFTGENYIP